MIPRVERDKRKANDQARKLEKRIKNREKVRDKYQKQYDAMVEKVELLRSNGYKEDSYYLESRAALVKSKLDKENKKIATHENSLRLHNNKWTRAGVIVTGKRLL